MASGSRPVYKTLEEETLCLTPLTCFYVTLDIKTPAGPSLCI